MPTKNFTTGTVIDSVWLNEVDQAVFEVLPALSVNTSKVTITPVPNGATITVPDGATATISGVNTGDQDLSNLATKAANTFTGTQAMPAQHFSVHALGSVSGTVNVDLAVASTFTATITGLTNVTFSNAPPAGKDQTVYLKLTNPGTNVLFPAGTLYPNSGAIPTFTAAGKDLVGVWYDAEQSKYVVGIIWKDYK